MIYSIMRSFKKRAASLSMPTPISSDDYYVPLGRATDRDSFVLSIPSFAESEGFTRKGGVAGVSENKNLVDDWTRKLQRKFSISNRNKSPKPASLASSFSTRDEMSLTKSKDPSPRRLRLLSHRRRLSDTPTVSISSPPSSLKLEPDTGRVRPPAPYFYAHPIVQEDFEECGKLCSPAEKEFQQSRPVLSGIDDRKGERTRKDATRVTEMSSVDDDVCKRLSASSDEASITSIEIRSWLIPSKLKKSVSLASKPKPLARTMNSRRSFQPQLNRMWQRSSSDKPKNAPLTELSASFPPSSYRPSCWRLIADLVIHGSPALSASRMQSLAKSVTNAENSEDDDDQGLPLDAANPDITLDDFWMSLICKHVPNSGKLHLWGRDDTFLTVSEQTIAARKDSDSFDLVRDMDAWPIPPRREKGYGATWKPAQEPIIATSHQQSDFAACNRTRSPPITPPSSVKFARHSLLPANDSCTIIPPTP